ncbi:MAG TPA: L-seryl-tRNA(Sec) selenium transferase [Ktedonobacterales bacterium]
MAQTRQRAGNGAAGRGAMGPRGLPSVDEVLRQDELRALATDVAHATLVGAVREVVAAARAEAVTRAAPDDSAAANATVAGYRTPDAGTLARRAAAALDLARRPELREVINATGVIVNTNLGRAPLSAAALEAMVRVSRGYSNLEYDLDAGERGSRQTHVRGLLRAVTGAEDALVVNNNAAAMLVVLSGLAAGREVVVSRGELVEIGGGFRVPDVMRQGGARLVEVGTTNRTRVEDYAAAIGQETGALLAVHPSNFRIFGFTEAPSRAALAELAHAHGLPLVEDLGSGCLLATERYGLAHEPTPMESLGAGADVVCFSGDKLLGGPQAGIIVGRGAALRTLARHPLMRAVRIDKLTLAALEATLRAYRDGTAEREIPIWRMLATSVGDVRARAERWVTRLAERTSGIARLAVVDGESTIGGGSLPGEMLPTALCAVELDSAALGAGTDAKEGPDVAARLAARLRRGSPPVVARVLRGRVLLDPRTVLPERDEQLVEAVAAALADWHAG